MRKFKFRVWDKETEKYYFPEVWLFPCHSGIGLIQLKDYPNTEKRGYGQIVVEQYTGLIDKNGKDICEGDIVLFGRIIGFRSFKAMVYYDELRGAFRMEYLSGNARTRLINSIRENLPANFDISLEVVGNIHEDL
jgi:uncharacterized phage protein (TIGR01671 family)